MSLVSQPDPIACSDEQHNMKVQDKIDTEHDKTHRNPLCTSRNISVNQYNTPAPTPEREGDQTNNGGALVLENRSANVPTTGTEETSIASHQVTTSSANPDCVETKFPFDLNSAPPSALEKEPTTYPIQVGDNDEENGFVTATSATKGLALAVVISMDSDFLEIHEDGDLGTVAFVDKRKGADPREYGGALYNPNSMIVPVGTTSTGGSDSIELVGVQLDKGKNVDPEERAWNGMAKYYEPGPSRIYFHDCGAMSCQEQVLLLQSSKRTKATDLNDGLHYDPTLPRLQVSLFSWFPKISPYRFMVFSIPLAFGTAKAVLSQKGSVTTPDTLELISGVVIFLVLFLLGSYELCRDSDIPKYLLWLFKPDCVNLVWYLAAKLSIQRPEYLSNEHDPELDPGAFITLYRILVSVVALFLGATFTYTSVFTDGNWEGWVVVAFVPSLTYLGNLYENNSIGLGSSFFRKDCSHLLRSIYMRMIICCLILFYLIVVVMIQSR